MPVEFKWPFGQKHILSFFLKVGQTFEYGDHNTIVLYILVPIFEVIQNSFKHKLCKNPFHVLFCIRCNDKYSLHPRAFCGMHYK